jgi:hypothetical protein
VRAPESVTRDDLEEASVVVLNDIDLPNAALEGFLWSSAARQAAIVVAPSLSAEAMIFNRRLVGRIGRSTLLAVDSAADGRSPVLTDTVSNLWQGFPRLVDRDARVFRWLSSLPGDVLARLDNGAALAVSAADAVGNRWVVLAGPLGTTTTNNLCETGFFVPFVDRLVSHAASGMSAREGRWVAGVARINPYFNRRGKADVYTADGALLATWSNQPSVQFDRPGLYRVQPLGEESYWLAVNADPVETDCIYRDPKVPAASARLVRVVDGAGMVSFVKSSGGGHFVPLLWALLACCLAAEIALWDWRRQAKKAGGEIK